MLVVNSSAAAPESHGGKWYPADAGVINVREAPYFARGDGRTDDTAAIQKALNAHTGQGTILYFPKGVYLISASLRLPIKNLNGQTNWGNTHLQGQSQTETILRLKDSTFTDAAKPAALLDSGPHGSADWFQNDTRDLTIDTGRGNPGAIGMRFFSNNTGCVRNVTIRSGDGEGLIGLDLAYNDMNGPLLIKEVAVRGFDIGVKTGSSVNSQTFSHLSVANQRRFGFRNEGQFLAIEDFSSHNAVPALSNASGLIALIGARLTGTGSANQTAAIHNEADMYVRDVRAEGYQSALETKGDTPSPAGLHIAEFASARAIRLFSGPTQALRLPVEPTPTLPDDAPATWVSPLQFGAHVASEKDAAPAIQAAIDSGATTVYLPSGNWRIGQTIHLRGNVRRLLGIECHIEPIPPRRD